MNFGPTRSSPSAHVLAPDRNMVLHGAVEIASGNRSYRPSCILACLLTTLISVTPVMAQDTGGAIDTRAAIERRIYELEGLMSGDVAAERQAVTLRWLAELYLSVGRVDDAEAAYEQILVFFPYDVASCNLFAEFLLDTRNDTERALKVTSDAIAWSREADSPPPYLGETYAIRARAFAKAGQCQDALRAAERAVDLSEEDASDDARRTSSRCLAQLGKNGEAQELLLQVIGDTGGSNPDDESALVALLTRDKKQVAAKEVDRLVAGAIQDGRKRREKALAREGAQMVELAGADRVRLEATLRTADGAAAILFVPDLGGRRSTFTAYAQLFTLDGFTTLTLDPRGHGDSRCDTLSSFDAISAHQREQIPADIATAFAYLVETRGVAPANIVVIAAGAGCNAVERAIHEHNLAPAVVYLSPIFPLEDRDLASAFSFRPPRPALVLASDEDAYAVRSMHAFQTAVANDAVNTKTYRAAGHGASLLRDPARFLDVDTWVKKSVDAPPTADRD